MAPQPSGPATVTAPAPPEAAGRSYTTVSLPVAHTVTKPGRVSDGYAIAATMVVGGEASPGTGVAAHEPAASSHASVYTPPPGTSNAAAHAAGVPGAAASTPFARSAPDTPDTLSAAPAPRDAYSRVVPGEAAESHNTRGPSDEAVARDSSDAQGSGCHPVGTRPGGHADASGRRAMGTCSSYGESGAGAACASADRTAAVTPAARRRGMAAA